MALLLALSANSWPQTWAPRELTLKFKLARAKSSIGRRSSECWLQISRSHSGFLLKMHILERICGLVLYLALVKRTQITASMRYTNTNTQQYARAICTPTLFRPRLLPCLTDHRAVADAAPILCRLSRVSDLHVIRSQPKGSFLHAEHMQRERLTWAPSRVSMAIKSYEAGIEQAWATADDVV